MARHEIPPCTRDLIQRLSRIQKNAVEDPEEENRIRCCYLADELTVIHTKLAELLNIQARIGISNVADVTIPRDICQYDDVASAT